LRTKNHTLPPLPMLDIVSSIAPKIKNPLGTPYANKRAGSTLISPLVMRP
jgi:hypothetical protein